LSSSSFLFSFISSITFHFESTIFNIGVISFFSHILANTLYAVANSKGVISQVPRAKGAQYIQCDLRDFTQSFLIKFIIFLSHQAIKNIFIAGTFLELFNAVEIFIFHINSQSKLAGIYSLGNSVSKSYIGVFVQICSLNIPIEYTKGLNALQGCNFEVIIFTFHLFSSSK
jgi:hypothetical protein